MPTLKVYCSPYSPHISSISVAVFGSDLTKKLSTTSMISLYEIFCRLLRIDIYYDNDGYVSVTKTT